MFQHSVSQNPSACKHVCTSLNILRIGSCNNLFYLVFDVISYYYSLAYVADVVLEILNLRE
jgi:hypothetical protein